LIFNDHYNLSISKGKPVGKLNIFFAGIIQKVVIGKSTNNEESSEDV